MHVLRHKVITYLLAGLVVITLTGCGHTMVVAPSTQTTTTTFPQVNIENYDANQNKVTHSYLKPPSRVVVTHPGATELLLELGLENCIYTTVAPYGQPIDHLADKYAKLTIMKEKYTPSLEELLSVQPDLIIGWAHHFTDSTFGDVRAWHDRSVGTYIMPSSLIMNKPTVENTIYTFIDDIGRIFGIQAKSSRLIADYQFRINYVKMKVQDVPQKKTVMVLQDHLDGKFSLYHRNYLISAMIDIAGGIHIADDITAMTSAEKVLSYNPDFIIFVSTPKPGATRDMTDSEAVLHLRNLEELGSLKAIEDGNIINLPFFSVNNGGIRTVETIEKIAHNLYPERF